MSKTGMISTSKGLVFRNNDTTYINGINGSCHNSPGGSALKIPPTMQKA